MSRITSRAGVVAIALLAVLTASIAIVVAVDSGGGPAVAASTSTNQTISLSGVGTVQGKPDTLTVNLGVDSHTQASVQDALNAIAADENKVKSALHGKGVEYKDIQTTDLQLNPSYDSHGIINGYDASESMSAQIHPLTNVGTILSAAASSAGNSVTINGLSFDIVNDKALLDAARKMAFNQAMDAATTDAGLAGEKLGHVISIKETQEESEPPVPFAYDSLAATNGAAKSLSVSPGRQPVSVTLDVVWTLVD